MGKRFSKFLSLNVGRVRETLQKQGLAENTLLIYTSDHGSHFRTRNSEYKRSCHDGCIRIPLIIHGPGFTGGHVRREFVSLIDLPPTILNAAAPLTDNRLCPQRNMRGRPLQDLMSGAAQDWPDEVFLQISESQCGRAIRTRKWKYSVRAPHLSGADPSSDVYVEDFLYDLDADPHEKNNLITHPDYLEIRNNLARTLKRRMVEAGEAEPAIRGKDETNSEPACAGDA